MVSPKCFKSPPLRASCQQPPMELSSSPGLPSLRQILSQKTTNAVLRSPSKGLDSSPSAPVFQDPIKFRNLKPLALPVSNDAPDESANRQQSNSPAIAKDNQRPNKSRGNTKGTQRRIGGGLGNAVSECVDAGKMSGNGAKVRPTSVRNDVADPEQHAHTMLEGDQLSGQTSHFFHKRENADPAELSGAKKGSNQETEPLSTKGTRLEANASTEPLRIPRAMTRRLDWTPPKHAEPIVLGSDYVNDFGPPASGAHEETKFSNLVQTYDFKDQRPTQRQDVAADNAEVLRKRKRIEMVETGPPAAAPPAPAISKTKAVKKKPRTITGLATAAYETPLVDAHPTPSLLNHFPPSIPANDDAVTKKGAKTAKPRKKPAKSKKKQPPPPPVLLSPAAALRQVAHQDFVFGTSSQLAKEKSPSLIRSIQAAIEASHQCERVQFVTPINSDALEPLEERPRLWDAGARDAEGDLFHLQITVPGEGSPQLPPPEPELDPFGYVQDDVGKSKSKAIVIDTTTDDSYVNLSDIVPHRGQGPIVQAHTALPAERDFTSSPPLIAVPHNDATLHPARPQQSTFDPQVDFGASSSPPLRSPHYNAQSVTLREHSSPLARHQPLALPSNSARSISSKATANAPARKKTKAAEVKKTKKPRSKKTSERADISEEETKGNEPPPSAQPLEMPKRKRGQPKKVEAEAGEPASVKPRKSRKAAPSKPAKDVTKNDNVVEIPDSESESAMSPRASRSPSPSLPIGEGTELPMSPSQANLHSPLFSSITQAVKSAPRSEDPANPSWHEKMLLYDPIVLEDLTEWLASGELERVGYEGEVTAAEVKKWCESRSICCLWKANLRGKSRKRL